jgi:hypothetical protein
MALLSLPNLPKAALCALTWFPKLTSSALHSISQLCDHGCSVQFDAKKVTVTFGARVVLTGPRNRTNGLWTVHLSPTEQTLPTRWIPQPQNCTYATQLPTITAPTKLHQVANNTYATQTKQELESLHGCPFIPCPTQPATNSPKIGQRSPLWSQTLHESQGRRPKTCAAAPPQTQRSRKSHTHI